ncbi:alpha/beta fold hydrolase [Mesorhizobium sp. M2D.F.Ca.ET.185.01.1.1]|uniref:alpha/beta fold hydrolase n=1 Tax=unclassified Mesorhizobium TaxID=325217 RepID=UPI000FCB6104|nr:MULTISPECIES: alpha/beta fold hydrolase [unclassified Mesorhizobium]TGP55370.1 alpha/beta fold hydrolase [bacterium M00.F.Ca.ET.230.01.1.1]TGP82517.1 alpha/beta fold hydrolase [bacterium M00.F.Ca.ET.227.01.1.1]TGP94272.1 alpha/beta fold hydrolase [bacterium M00.F.Ca.ET.221.01.1.1]TGP97727.1 alpha/beta fold hydrolase [bacterium M00.F.Ca.ET.222.01.1.1]TGT75228.1 alpha/beta fold hydrolase [bacterium M00.F.Ca.ET.159.01.1.1]TGT88095.1 alpha/beta fold hydrolase [bacterium M00.F.Ca.ET.157.01.1.1]
MLSSPHAVECGAGSKTVVLLHGFGSCQAIWHDVAASLAPVMRVLAYDLPGHGHSLECEGIGGAKQAARTILADLAARRPDKVHLVGHSMGGAVATLMALADPGRVASLTLLAPGGFGPEINAPLLRRYAAAAGRKEIRACLAAMSGTRSVPPEHVVDALYRMRKRPDQLQALIDMAAGMTRDDRQGVIPGAQLDTLDMPVMVVWGAEDPLLPVDQSEALPSHFHLHHVLDAGHMLVEEAPDLVAEIVRRNTRRRTRRQRPVFGAAAS